MKRIILSLFILIGFVVSFPVASNAQINQSCIDNPELAESEFCKNQVDDAGQSPITGEDGIITTATELLAIIVGVASTIGIILGGFFYVTSNGEAQRAASARSTILYSLVGLAIAFTAQLIVIFVLDSV